jgi:UDP-perosamine 4-acetyltransferase
MNEKDKIIVVGGGGHCKVALDILLQNEEFDVVGIIDRNVGQEVLSIPVIGNDDTLELLYNSGIKKCFIAIGNNMLRCKLHTTLSKIGYEFINVISRYSYISLNSEIGTGNIFMPGSIVNASSVIGNGCIVNTNASVDHDCFINDFVHIAPSAALAGKVTVGKSCFLGIGCKVIDGITICDNVIVGAGSTVIRNILSSCTVVGTPAKVIK